MRPVMLTLLLAVTACGTSTSADAGSGADSGRALEAWERDLLAAHNSVRAAAMPAPSPALEPLTWSPTVASAAQAWADRCTFEHNTQSGYGENLFASTAASNAAATISSWTDEAADYTYENNTCTAGKVCGHYTQVVWRSSKELGCGKATCTTNSPFGSGSWYLWVCDYSPPGNYLGQKPY